MPVTTLAAGTELPSHRVTARMPAEVTENKIHEDTVAREFGFRGALVPGVTVYAWMTHPVVAALGPEWLERGTFAVRLAKPAYFGEPVTVEGRVAEADGDRVVIQTRAVDRDGQVCATATMALSSAPAAPAPDPSDYATAALPADRPRVSRDVLSAITVLGTPEVVLDRDVAGGFLDRVSEPLPLYVGDGAPAHPGLYLSEANRALSKNVVVSPWIHVESEGRHLSPLRMGERLETRGRVKSLFEKKGHQFVELDLLQVANGTRPVAHVRHVAIYQVRGVS